MSLATPDDAEIIRLAERRGLTIEGVIDAGFERLREAGPDGREMAHRKACAWMKRTMGPRARGGRG